MNFKADENSGVKERNIEIVNTVDGQKTICINNVYLHSKYYPLKEAQTFLNSTKTIYENKNIVVIYGFGLGYHIKELLKRLDKRCKIYVFDIDSDVFNIAKRLNLTEEILSDSRVEVFIGYSNNFLDELYKKMNMVEDILVFKSSLKVLPEKYDYFRQVINWYLVAKDSREKFEPLLKKNYQLNMQERAGKISDFLNNVDFSGEPVILVSAGPSLDVCIDSLKELQGKIKIFAVGRALKALIKNNIKPDMVCILDAQDVVYEHIKDCENPDVPLCFASTSSNLAVRNYKGPKFIFFNDEEHGDIMVPTGKSVATAILSVAILGKANPIIFVGQDLAFTNNLSHSRFCNNSRISGIVENYKKVVGVTGEILNTSEGLLYFKHWIEKAIKANPDIKFINCSSGARIEGTVEKDIRKLTQYYLKT